MARFNTKVERRIKMQQLIELINQNTILASNTTYLFPIILACLFLLASLFVTVIMYKVPSGKHRVGKTIRAAGIIAAVLTIGVTFYGDHTNQTKIKANNIKIERIEKSVIRSQSSKYPFCISMEDNGFISSNQTLVFFHNKQDAINFVQKNQNNKNIFVTNYLEFDDSTLIQGSDQTIENDFDQMQVEPTQKALTQTINGYIQND